MRLNLQHYMDVINDIVLHHMAVNEIRRAIKYFQQVDKARAVGSFRVSFFLGLYS